MPLTFTAKMRSNSASVTSSSGLLTCVVPALLTTMSSRPNALCARPTMALTSALLLTSARHETACLPRRAATFLAPASLRSATTTLAPSATKRLAMPSPKPCAPPVTTATLSCSLNVSSLSLAALCLCRRFPGAPRRRPDPGRRGALRRGRAGVGAPPVLEQERLERGLERLGLLEVHEVAGLRHHDELRALDARLH